MFLGAFKITGPAVFQIILLGGIGYFLLKKDILGDVCLDALSRLVLDVTLPLLMFCQLIRDFTFRLYPEWWVFPLISIAVTLLGLGVGSLFSHFIQGREHRFQFISLVGFQNSGYLPLALLAALLPKWQVGTMFIYLFLFLLGFNLTMFSVGVYMLVSLKDKKFEWSTLFNPPVLAVLISLLFVFLRINTLIPDFIYQPIRMVGDCTLPLAMFVVGGSLAQMHFGRIDKKAAFLVVLSKLLILPLLGFLFLMRFKVAPLIGLLILIQLAMPPAANLTAIIRHYKREDLLISQGIFIGHILSIITLPLFLSLYFMFVMLK